MAKERSAPSHRWRFFRAGGVDQVRIDTGADIDNLEHLDQKLWVALSCPTKGLEFDQRTLELLDADGDGRVRAPEILGAIAWARSCLKNLDSLVKGAPELPLAAIDPGKKEGKRVLASAQHVLAMIGQEGATSISVADATKAAAAAVEAARNGDGVVPPDAVADDGVRKVVEDILATVGGEDDRSGKKGVTKAKVAAFFDALAAHVAWWRSGRSDKDVWPLGDDTAPAYAAVEAVRAKVDDYFTRCQLAAFDERAAGALNRDAAAYAELAAKILAADLDDIAALPLAQVAPGKPLPLAAGINPAWSARIATLRDRAVVPIAGKESAEALTADGWAEVKAKLAPIGAWMAGQKGREVAALGAERATALLAGDARRARGRDPSRPRPRRALRRHHFGGEAGAHPPRPDRAAAQLRLVRKLLWPQAGGVPGRHAVPRWPQLRPGRARRGPRQARRAGHQGRHLPHLLHLLAPSGEKLNVAAAFTAGDSDHLFVGRNGVFYDRKGRDWDASITSIVEHPISIGQAFWSPYKRTLRWIEDTVAKRAAAADEASVGNLTTSVGDAAAGKGAPPKSKFDVGTIAALGVAVGGITAAMGALLGSFFGLGMWMPLGVLGLILLISGPSMVIAWMKLRKRNLGPILDANGWAVNGRVKVNIPLGASLTDRAKLPEGAERSTADPFAQKKRWWPRLLIVLIVLGGAGYALYRAGYLPQWYDQIKQRWFSSEPAPGGGAGEQGK